METLKIDPRNVNPDEMIERGTHLHGHLEPFLVAGIRMGLLALEDFRRGELISKSRRTAVRPLEELFTWEQAL